MTSPSPASVPTEAEPEHAPCWMSGPQADAWAAGFNAAHRALAPILAEKEREIRERDDWVTHWQTKCQATRALELAAEATLAAERERCALIVEEVSVPAPTGMAGMEQEVFHQGADAMNEAIAAAIRAQITAPGAGTEAGQLAVARKIMAKRRDVLAALAEND